MPNADLLFCPRCAARLEWRGVDYPDVLHPVCTACGFVLWQNVKPTVEALIVRGDGAQAEVLLGRLGTGSSSKGLWDLPGGFLNAGDGIESALVRECRREMGIEIAVGDLVGAFEFVFYDIPIVSLIYVCTIASGEPRAADIIDDVRWFPLHAPPAVAYAAVRDAIAVLGRKIGP